MIFVVYVCTMRFSYFLFIGLLLASCSSNRVTVMMRDGAKIKSELLSVRDSSIITQEKGGAPIGVRNSEFDSVLYNAGSSLPYTIGGGLVVGGLGVLVATTNLHGAPNKELPVIISGALVGFALGWVFGGIISPDDKVFHLDNRKEKEDLRTYGKYLSHEEPDELKKIK